ncbi:alpha-tocopherol transfer protein-like [Colias croceus]|uniref:alpha-tocopherol transfer protein-like n=1 Tax=Colias crocea TaxID=72248 RepID=UPI001E27C49C|nr:alpha-tocopherol transfer protein-like [Colias croceus]XP_045490791.1 alpha-tocopherol transfer protein-like [Colias croceus]
MSIRALSPELAEKARLELNEDSNRLQSDIQHIKDWLSKQPHLRARTDDQFIVSFLRGCKFSLERTKEKIDLYYSLRTMAPELFSVHAKDARFKEIMSQGSYIILPKTCASDKTRITLIRPGRYDANKYSIIDILSAANNLEKIILVDDDAGLINGRRTIVDLEGVTMAHFVQMSPSNMKKMIVLGQDATPMRMKGAHYINLPNGFDVVFNAMRSLLNEKNRNRLLVHNKNYEEMYKYIPKEALPAEYGGNAGTIDEILDYWMKKTDEFSSWLEEDLQYGSDESKRPGKPKTAADYFGVDGSFRQLDFD